MNLSDEQIAELEQLAGCGYTLKQIAMYFNIPLRNVVNAYQDEESVFRYHYDRGKLIVQAQIDISATQSAQNGNLTAMQRLDKLSSKRNFINARDRMINSIITPVKSKFRQLYPAKDEDPRQ